MKCPFCAELIPRSRDRRSIRAAPLPLSKFRRYRSVALYFCSQACKDDFRAQKDETELLGERLDEGARMLSDDFEG